MSGRPQNPNLAALLAHILAGKHAKEFDGMSTGLATRTLNNHGIFKYYLTPDEWAHIRERRGMNPRRIAA